MSQGKLKPVWDSAQMADGAGGLTAKTVSHAFTEDNIVQGSLTWRQPEHYNIVRIHYLDSANDYKKTSVEVKDEHDIAVNGESLYEETCFFITDAEIARRRARYRFNKFIYTDYECDLSAFSGAGDLELYDLVTVTHTLPGWSAKQFLVTGKGEDIYGRMKFTLAAYYSGIYDDAEASEQAGYESDLPNPYGPPGASTGLTLALVSPGTGFDFDSVKVTFTPPADPFYSHTEIYISKDDTTYYLAGISSGESLVIQGMGMFYVPGDTVYIKIRNVNELGVFGDLSAYESILITSSIRLGSFYAGLYDLWGGNAAIGNAATTIVMGNLDGTPKIALGASADAIAFAGAQPGFYVDGGGNLRVGGATHGLKFDAGTGVLSVSDKLKVGSGTYIDIDGGNARIRSSNYVSGVAGAGFTLEPDLLEVGNIAARGIFRTAVFQKDVVSAVGGNLIVLPADVLATDMSAADSATLTIEGNETFAVNDLLRIKDGTDDEWLEITNTGSAPTYSVTRDKGGDYGADANPAWKKGATVVNYGQSGDGFVYMTASETNAPYLSVVTHAGSPWDTLATRLRIGNLNGFLGYSSDLYGIAIGETDKYLKYDPTNGLKIKGLVEIIGNPALQNMLMNGGFEETDGTNAYYWETGTGITTETSGGDHSNKYLKVVRSGDNNYLRHALPDGNPRYFEVNEGEVYEGGGSLTGDGSCAAYFAIFSYDKDKGQVGNAYTMLVTAAWTAKSVIYTVPSGVKFIVVYLGAINSDGSAGFDNIYLKRVDEKAWSFTHASDRTKIDGGNIYTNTITASQINGAGFGTLTITSGKIQINTTDALEIAAAGNIKVLAGGDIVMIGDDSNPGNLIFQGSSYSVSTGLNAAGTTYEIFPLTDRTVSFDLGGQIFNSNQFQDVFLQGGRYVSLKSISTDADSAEVQSFASTGYVSIFLNLYHNSVGQNIEFKYDEDEGTCYFGDRYKNKVIDLGRSGNAWDDAYADDYNNEADLFWLDEHDDLAAILGIGKSTVIDPRTGLPLIDDSTLPEWMFTRSKDGKHILYSKDGKPWLTNKILFSIFIGALKQLDAKVEALK